MGLLGRLIAPILVSSALFGCSNINRPLEESAPKISMPSAPEYDYDRDWFKTLSHPSKNIRVLVNFYDLNRDGKYDIVVAYLLCDQKKGSYLRAERPFGVFYKNSNTLYLDNLPTDNLVDGVIYNPGKRDIRKDAPSCPTRG